MNYENSWTRPGEGILEAKANFTPKELNKLSDNMNLNNIQKMILFDYVRKGVLNQKYSGKAAARTAMSK